MIVEGDVGITEEQLESAPQSKAGCTAQGKLKQQTPCSVLGECSCIEIEVRKGRNCICIHSSPRYLFIFLRIQRKKHPPQERNKPRHHTDTPRELHISEQNSLCTCQIDFSVSLNSLTKAGCNVRFGAVPVCFGTWKGHGCVALGTSTWTCKSFPCTLGFEWHSWHRRPTSGCCFQSLLLSLIM